MGLKSAQANGIALLHEMSIQRHKVSSHPFAPPSLYLCLHKKLVLEISRQIQMFSTKGRDLPHPTPFPLLWGWIADYGVDYEIR